LEEDGLVEEEKSVDFDYPGGDDDLYEGDKDQQIDDNHLYYAGWMISFHHR
jgi:hypothetical protein